MNFKFTLLWSDALLFLLVSAIVIFVLWARTKEPLRAPWRKVMKSKMAVTTLTILMVFITIGLLDSMHFQTKLNGNGPNGEVHYSPQLKSVLDIVVAPLAGHYEKTYSAPLANHLYSKETTILADGALLHDYPQLKHKHLFGTDKVGQDVLYQSLKSIRTGLIIGTLTTLIMLPFAIFFGIAAGYFGGFIDDVIQYVYTTLSSIPGVLLIAAAILSLQVFISNHAEYFPTLASRADARLLALCLILGVHC